MDGCVQLLVIAKSPKPGRAKTRLSPPLSTAAAAAVAEAALASTLQIVIRTPASRRVLVLDGAPGRWLPSGIDVIAQRGRGFDEKLGNAFSDAGAPAVLIGMDTPQVTSALLSRAGEALMSSGVDAVLGRAFDGGWWAIGLRRADPKVFLGVPMSRRDTGDAQHARLRALGLRTAALPRLRDVDTIDDARAVADMIPDSVFSETLARHLLLATGRPA